MSEHYLQGGCSCGRNQYEVVLPPREQTQDTAQVLFGGSSETRRAFGSSLPTLLRVPLPWLQSTTYAYTKGERSVDIKRAFSHHSSPQVKRNFCGFCGTPLTFWTEERPEDANYICINLASLERASLNLLDTLSILPSADEDEDDLKEVLPRDNLTKPAGDSPGNISGQHRLIRGEPWFEELIKEGPLGRVNRRRGGHMSGDGNSVIEWEIIEIDGEEDIEAPHKKQNIQQSQDDERMDG